MATMSNPDRLACWVDLMKRTLGPFAFDKLELRAAVDAVDDQISANEAALNNWFPTEFKAKATSAQKAAVLAYVLMKRYEVL